MSVPISVGNRDRYIWFRTPERKRTSDQTVHDFGVISNDDENLCTPILNNGGALVLDNHFRQPQTLLKIELVKYTMRAGKVGVVASGGTPKSHDPNAVQKSHEKCLSKLSARNLQGLEYSRGTIQYGSDMRTEMIRVFLSRDGQRKYGKHRLYQVDVEGRILQRSSISSFAAPAVGKGPGYGLRRVDEHFTLREEEGAKSKAGYNEAENNHIDYGP